MDRFGQPSEEHQPITWLGGYPLYAAHLIVLVYVVSMIVTAIVGSGSVLYDWLLFDRALVLQGQLWRFLTYGLWNLPSIPFAINMVFLAMFGREVEKFFGRLVFLRFYFVLYLVPPLLFMLVGLWWPLQLAGASGCLAVFVAFATLYPSAVLMFEILAKWAAIILVGVFALMALAVRNYPELLSLTSSVLFAYWFVRYHQGHFTLPRLSLPRRKPKLRVLPDLEPDRPKSAAGRPTENSMAEIDALLDKIAQSGISSLTAKERAKLDRAREDLKNRGSRRS
jgi:membrane associated rhomboid family serine protease